MSALSSEGAWDRSISLVAFAVNVNPSGLVEREEMRESNLSWGRLD
jgi:hypothetical protein